MRRFIERFRLWRQQRAVEREDKFGAGLLVLALVILARNAHTLITTHHLTWRGGFGSIVTLAFVVLYIRQARWTWIPLMALAVSFLAEAPFASSTGSTHDSTTASLLITALAILFAVGTFIFSLTVRKRFAGATRAI